MHFPKTKRNTFPLHLYILNSNATSMKSSCELKIFQQELIFCSLGWWQHGLYVLFELFCYLSVSTASYIYRYMFKRKEMWIYVVLEMEHHLCKDRRGSDLFGNRVLHSTWVLSLVACWPGPSTFPQWGVVAVATHWEFHFSSHCLGKECATIYILILYIISVVPSPVYKLGKNCLLHVNFLYKA